MGELLAKRPKDFLDQIDPEDSLPSRFARGSMGRPKAVMLTHQQLIHIALRYSASIDVVPEDRIAILASLSDSAGMYMAWCGLLSGASLCPFPTMEKGVTGLDCWMMDRGISIYSSAASLFRQFAQTLADETRFPLVRVVRIGGERATCQEFNAYQKRRR